MPYEMMARWGCVFNLDGVDNLWAVKDCRKKEDKIMKGNNMHADNYIVEFLIDKKSYFCIWHSDERDVFWTEKDKIIYFTEITELQRFCEKEKVQIDEEVITYDVDKLIVLLDEDKLEIDCNFCIDMWNIFQDCAYSAGEKFNGDKEKRNHVYSKLFYGLNLPVINTSGKQYIPEFSASEKEEIVDVLNEGLFLLRKQFNLERL